MMLIATAVASALFASTAFTPAAAAVAASSAIPPMVVSITTAAALSPSLVKAILAESDAIWRPTGVTFVWQRAPRSAAYANAPDAGPYVPNTLHLVIGDNRGNGGDGRVPLGWIVFDDVSAPEQEIYLSLANAKHLLETSPGIVGNAETMPTAQRETLLARALGRALAHELGHYLLASKVHTERGLMKAILTAAELFMPDARGFRIEPAQRGAVAARLRGEPLVASR